MMNEWWCNDECVWCNVMMNVNDVNVVNDEWWCNEWWSDECWWWM